MDIKQDVIAAIGNTPLIKLRKASELTGCTILGKAEFMNPGQSVKDRAALFIIRDAIARGSLKPGGTIVEGTAGNTGIGLTVVANAMGFRSVIVIPVTQSQEKKDALRQLGAELVEVPAVPYKNPNNYVKYSGRLAKAMGAVWANQFDNVANRQAHIETTAPEIWAQTDGKVDAFVAAVGSGGTLAGVSMGLKSRKPEDQDRPGRPDGRCSLQLLQARRTQVRRLLHHRRHRPGPHHRQPGGRHRGRGLPDPGQRGHPDRLRPAGARRPLHGRLDGRQCRGCHPHGQGSWARATRS